jgi:uncharacterized protein YecT (DUF1311 family)
MDARGASFDCHKASIAAEVKVCADAKLSALDDELSLAYNSALAHASEPQLLKRQQREWTQFRNGCDRGSPDCIEHLYVERVAELKGSSQTSIYRFRGFRDEPASPAERPGEPWRYVSPTAEALWSFVATRLNLSQGVRSSIDARDRAEFARIGPDSFLVQMSGFYLAQPSSGRWEELVGVGMRDDAWDPPDFRPLPRNGIWVLLHAQTLSRGSYTEYYGALFVKSSGDKALTVNAVDIASYSDVDSELCARSTSDDPEPENSPPTAEHVESTDVMDINHDSMDDIVFHVAKQDCKTLDITTRNDVFMNTGAGFRQESPAK